MIEIYLFIHPLCPNCLAMEKRILQMVQTKQHKIQFKFLPYLSLDSFDNFIFSQGLPEMNLPQRNTFFENSYAASLDYKTMLLQGKRKGRAFLFSLQEKVGVNDIPYSRELVEEIVLAVDGDLSMFWADRQSILVKDSYWADQETAREMNVTRSGSIVIFNYESGDNFGILIEEEPTQELLDQLVNRGSKSVSLLGLSLSKSKLATNDEFPHFLKLLEN